MTENGETSFFVGAMKEFHHWSTVTLLFLIPGILTHCFAFALMSSFGKVRFLEWWYRPEPTQ